MLKYPGCTGWHDTRNSSWLSDTTYGFRRGYSGIFSISGGDWTSNSCGRGVAVVGTGL